jgi:hypothetical protein
MNDTCEIKSDPLLHATAFPIEEEIEIHSTSTDPIDDGTITDQVSQFDPNEFKRL